MDSIEGSGIGPTTGNVAYMILGPDGSVQYVGSTGNLTSRWIRNKTSRLRLSDRGFVVVTLGPFTTRSEAYRTEDRLLRALCPPLNSVHYVPALWLDL